MGPLTGFGMFFADWVSNCGSEGMAPPGWLGSGVCIVGASYSGLGFMLLAYASCLANSSACSSV